MAKVQKGDRNRPGRNGFSAANSFAVHFRYNSGIIRHSFSFEAAPLNVSHVFSTGSGDPLENPNGTHLGALAVR